MGIRCQLSKASMIRAGAFGQRVVGGTHLYRYGLGVVGV